VVGQFQYENIYRLTLYSISTLSSAPLSFYGKFPYWLGDTRFSLIIACIPLTIFLTSKILRHSKHALTITVLTYAIYFIFSYTFVCISTGLSFHVSNDFYQGEEIQKNLTAVNINEIIMTTIILTTVATLVTFLLANFIRRTRLKISQSKSH